MFRHLCLICLLLFALITRVSYATPDTFEWKTWDEYQASKTELGKDTRSKSDD